MKHLSVFAAATCAALLLGGCAAAIEGSTQTVHFETPGAYGAVCHIMSNGVHYRVFPPQDYVISRSKKPLNIRCLAPGNREKTEIVPPEVLEAAMLNVGTGFFPGMAWDYSSGSMFIYPATIEIDFSDVEPLPSALPGQEAADINSFDKFQTEQISPGWPLIERDRNPAPSGWKKIERPEEDSDSEASAPGNAPAAENPPSLEEQLKQKPDNFGPDDYK